MSVWKRCDHRILPALIILSVAASAMAFTSEHTDVAMVWNAGSFDCEAIPMELVGDGTWECVAPIPAAEIYYLQFWPGGALDPKYGADLMDPAGLLYDDDPPQVPVQLDRPGYYYVRLFEGLPGFEVVGAPASIEVVMTFNDAPPVLPAGAGVGVVDVDGDVMLGWTASVEDGGSGIATVAHMLPGRMYRLTATADGYADATIEVDVHDPGNMTVPVTLDRLVPNEISTWSEVKALYR